MLATVAVTVATHNLAYGVIVGVMTAMVLFARRVAHLTEVVDVAHPDENTRVYAVRGELFFASSNDLIYQFDYVGDPENVVIDLSDSHIWDASTVATLDAITTKYRGQGQDRHHRRFERGLVRAARAAERTDGRRSLTSWSGGTGGE